MYVFSIAMDVDLIRMFTPSKGRLISLLGVHKSSSSVSPCVASYRYHVHLLAASHIIIIIIIVIIWIIIIMSIILTTITNGRVYLFLCEHPSCLNARYAWWYLPVSGRHVMLCLDLIGRVAGD